MTVVVDAGVNLYMDGTEVIAADLWRWPTSSNTRDLENHLSPSSTTVFNNAFDFESGALGGQRDKLVIGARLVALSGGVANNFFRGKIAHVMVHNNPADNECVMRIHRGNGNPLWAITTEIIAADADNAAVVATSSGSTISGSTDTATATTVDRTSGLDGVTSSATTDSSTAATSTATSSTPVTSGVSGGRTTSSILGRRVQTVSATAEAHLDACDPSPCSEGEVCNYDISFCLVECTDVDECNSNPCENSAPCVNQADVNARCKTCKATLLACSVL
eukprot:SAG31_NODE_1028_length_10273_cov_22.700413_3_plen_277_part_00